MAKITSRASLNVGTELAVNTTTRKITLNVAGNLIAKDGVSWQALYSKLIDLWTSSTYNDFPFPFYTIDVLSGQFNIGFDGSRYNTWMFADDASRTYLRDGGWSEYAPTAPGTDGTSATGSLARQYVGIVSLGSVSTGSQLYWQAASTDAPTNFTYADAANQGIQVMGDISKDATTTTFDKRTFFKGFVREYAKKYKDSILADTGKTATGAYLVNLLLSNEDDLDIKATDVTVSSATDPWQKMKIRYFASAFQKDIDLTGTTRSFGIVVDVGTHSGVDGTGTSGTPTFTTAAAGITGANFVGGTLKIHNGAAKGTYNISGTPASGSVTLTSNLLGAASAASFTLYPAVNIGASLQQIYTFIQYKLRQATSINDGTAGTVTGKTASMLLNFVGSRLDAGFYAPTNSFGGGSGVVVEGVASADINTIRFYDNTATSREYPYASAGAMNFNTALVGGYYRLFFTTNPTGNYGSATAVTVNDSTGTPIAGTIGASSVGFTFDYTGNVQGGRTGNTDAAVTLVAGKPGSAKPVVSTGTITQSKAVSLNATAEQDRAYA